jgi:broad specificity phosphatase PhoE
VRFYFARHGESDANRQHVFANLGDGPPLTSRGRQQARTLARQLSCDGIEHIYASPLLRARQTADTVAARLRPVLTRSRPRSRRDRGRRR